MGAFSESGWPKCPASFPTAAGRLTASSATMIAYNIGLSRDKTSFVAPRPQHAPATWRDELQEEDTQVMRRGGSQPLLARRRAPPRLGRHTSEFFPRGQPRG